MPHNSKKTTEMLKEIEAVFEEKFGGKVGMGICYTLPQEGYREVHFITNLKRQDGARLFANTATKMMAQTN